jgi:hypothetical protein
MLEAYAATVCFTCEGEYSESIWTVSVRADFAVLNNSAPLAWRRRAGSANPIDLRRRKLGKHLLPPRVDRIHACSVGVLRNVARYSNKSKI